MVTVARRAIVRHAALRAVALDAALFRGQKNVRRVAAMFHVVAPFAFHLEMFSVIERRPKHPAVGNLRRRDDRRIGRFGDLMAIGAAREMRRALRIKPRDHWNGAGLSIAEKYPAFERFARAKFGADSRVIGVRELHERVLSDNPFFCFAKSAY